MRERQQQMVAAREATTASKGKKNIRASEESGDWKFTLEADEADSVFGDHGDLAGLTDGAEGTFAPEAAAVGADRKGGDPLDKRPVAEDQGDIFDGIDRELAAKEGGGGENVEWETAEGYKPWMLGVDDEGSNLFDVGKEGEVGIEGIDDNCIDAHEKERIEEQKQLEKKEEELLVTLKVKYLITC